MRAGRLSFTTSYEEGLEGTEFVFIAVDTPSGVDGEADLRYVAAAAESIAKLMKEMLGDLQGKTIGLLGLSFKPNTDDMRDAPSIDIAKSLVAEGAYVRAYDPVAMDVARPGNHATTGLPLPRPGTGL